MPHPDASDDGADRSEEAVLQPPTEDDDEARDREEAKPSTWRALACCTAGWGRRPQQSGSEGAPPTSTFGLIKTIKSWRFGSSSNSAQVRKFNPGPGYERVPLAYSDSDASFADEPTPVGGSSSAVVGRSSARRHGSPTLAKSSSSRGSFGALPIDPSAPTGSLAALAQRLEGLSMVSAVRVSLDLSTDSIVHLRISGPMRTEYTLDPDGYIMEAVRTSHRLPASLFDANGCPVSPIVAMDALEELIAKALRATRGVGVVTAVTLENLALTSSTSTSARHAVAVVDDDNEDVVSRREAALLRAKHNKNAALADHLLAAAEGFRADYTPGEVRQRVRHFVHNVLEAISSPALIELSLVHCTFGDAFMFADLLTSPCIPRASRRDRSHPWTGGLRRLEVKHCGLTAAHFSTLLRELNAVQRGLHPYLEGNLFTVLTHLTLLGTVSSAALQNLLGFISDTSDTDSGHAGLQHLIVDEELVAVVLKHRAAPFLTTINGRLMADELAPQQ